MDGGGGWGQGKRDGMVLDGRLPVGLCAVPGVSGLEVMVREHGCVGVGWGVIFGIDHWWWGWRHIQWRSRVMYWPRLGWWGEQ